ncbi:hypothetical protein RJT34_23498 [Clitoria ternatea]|uniref:Uncharacterized protein n=1 Tax=Clitoria ternatea TaxID=43366 RepID=A0AAN9IH94_CLITE
MCLVVRSSHLIILLLRATLALTTVFPLPPLLTSVHPLPLLTADFPLPASVHLSVHLSGLQLLIHLSLPLLTSDFPLPASVHLSVHLSGLQVLMWLVSTL